MPYSSEVKELAYTLDPPAWVSYSGKDVRYKQTMEERRKKALKNAQDQIDAQTPSPLSLQEQIDDLREKLENLASQLGIQL